MAERRRLPPATEATAEPFVVELPGSDTKLAYGRYDFNFNQTFKHVQDMTPVAAEAAIKIEKARHVSPVRTIVVGFVACVLFIGLMVLAVLWAAHEYRLDWQITVAALVVLAALIVPTRTLIAKLVEQMFKNGG